MTKNFVAYRLVIDYSLIISNNQWLINWLPIDHLLITHWCHWCHRLVMSGLNKLKLWWETLLNVNFLLVMTKKIWVTFSFKSEYPQVTSISRRTEGCSAIGIAKQCCFGTQSEKLSFGAVWFRQKVQKQISTQELHQCKSCSVHMRSAGRELQRSNLLLDL